MASEDRQLSAPAFLVPHKLLTEYSERPKEQQEKDNIDDGVNPAAIDNDNGSGWGSNSNYEEVDFFPLPKTRAILYFLSMLKPNTSMNYFWEILLKTLVVRSGGV